jgi:hypothetical protein
MNRKHKRSKTRRQVVRVWTCAQARAALPYIGSVMRSLREHWLNTQRHEGRRRRLAAKPGRPDRGSIIAQEEADRDAGQARERFNEAYEELEKIEVYCIDPLQGVGVLPFVHEEKLAWLIYDLFAGDDLHHWRYHDDPLEMRRPIREIEEESSAADLAV